MATVRDYLATERTGAARGREATSPDLGLCASALTRSFGAVGRLPGG
jgi:hypothetical protein